MFSAEGASIFYAEEDDMRSWFYSKYLVEQEREEHIKRLKEGGIPVPQEELAEDNGSSFLYVSFVFKFYKTHKVVQAHFNERHEEAVYMTGKSDADPSKRWHGPHS